METFGARFIHLHISASDEVRRDRYAEDASVSFESADDQPVEAGIGPLAKLAQIHLTNEGSLSELKQSLDQVISEISKSGKCLSQ